jgi:4-diphosphocytidyl-2-C-methyl-D-erythritol kinase
VEAFSDWSTLESLAVNDFEGSVLGRYELLGQIRAALHESGARPARLSGSGAALFGIFSDDLTAEAARDALTRRFPDTHFVLTRTAGPR